MTNCQTHTFLIEFLKMEKKTYNIAIDGMRIVAILAVIAIHTTTRILEASDFNLQGYSFSLFINQASRFAVPLFFMISGFVLELNYSYNQSYLGYLQKRLTKIFLPYLFWSAIYYFFIYTKHTISFFQTLFVGAASYQLYFIPTLIIFYILFPLIHRNYRFIANKWILIILGLVQLFLLYQEYYIEPLPYFYPVSIAFLNFYIFILGMVFSRNLNLLQKIGKWKILLSALFIILAFVVFFEGKLLYLKTHNYLFFYSQWRPSVFFYSVVLASLMYVLFNKNNLNKTFVKNLSRLSFFVFFIHVIVLETFWHTFGHRAFSSIPEVLFNLLFFFCVIGGSYAIAYAAHKSPYLSKLSG